MLYPFMTLNDDTEIVHSEAYLKNNKEVVRVEIEKPIEGGFAHATCFLPDYKWCDVEGFSSDEMNRLYKLIESTSHVIIPLARTGGFENAANF